MAGIIAFFTALPQVVALIGQLGSLLQKLMTAADKNNLRGWMDDLEKRIDNLSAATTETEKYSAVKDLLKSIGNIAPN